MRRLALSTVVALLLVGALAANASAQATPPPPPTEGEKAAAFPPDLQGHAVHDGTLNFMVLFDQLEWQRSGANGAIWDTKTWVGGDVNRIWLRSEGDVQGGTVDDAEAHLMLGRAVSRWWDVVGGVRQDFAPGTGRTWAAIGIQGLAPQWFEVEATAYLGESARTAFRVEVEYEMLLTNRLVVQPLVEVNVFGKADPEREVGAGLSTVEVGARVRYEITRELAPYVGLMWHRKVFATGDLAREHGGDVGGWRFASGLRLWF